LTKTRLPPTWLVLVPALALAAVGARAVMAEMRASQDAARDRARSVASRLARSVDALVAEYAAPLADEQPDPEKDVLATIAPHLEPRGLFAIRVVYRDSGRLLDVRPHRALLNRGAKYDLASDALARARSIAEQPGGAEAAAAMLSATAEFVEDVKTTEDVQDSGLRWPLRLAQARYELKSGDARQAIESLRTAARHGDHGFYEFDGERFPETALVLAAEAADRIPPDWLVAAYERCASSPLLVDAASLDAIESLRYE